MIGPGWLPGYKPRSQAARRRTLPYTRVRRRSRPRAMKHDAAPRAVNTDFVLFDHGPAELPTATAVPRETRGRVIAAASDLKRWLAARWTWFRPRTVPCAVAALGMVGVIASANYLAHPQPDAPVKHRIVRIDVAQP